MHSDWTYWLKPTPSPRSGSSLGKGGEWCIKLAPACLKYSGSKKRLNLCPWRTLRFSVPTFDSNCCIILQTRAGSKLSCSFIAFFIQAWRGHWLPPGHALWLLYGSLEVSMEESVPVMREIFKFPHYSATFPLCLCMIDLCALRTHGDIGILK